MFQNILALIFFLIPFLYTPGPTNIIFAATGARFGLRSTLPANVGYNIALWVTTMALGMGLISILEKTPAIFLSLKYAGAVYVLWLAWKLLWAGKRNSEQTARPISMMEGAILLLFNPKAFIVIAVLLTNFLDSMSLTLLPTVGIIATVYSLSNFIAFIFWAQAGNKIAGLFRTDNSALPLNIIFAGTLVLVAGWMIFL